MSVEYGGHKLGVSNFDDEGTTFITFKFAEGEKHCSPMS